MGYKELLAIFGLFNLNKHADCHSPWIPWNVLLPMPWYVFTDLAMATCNLLSIFQVVPYFW